MGQFVGQRKFFFGDDCLDVLTHQTLDQSTFDLVHSKMETWFISGVLLQRQILNVNYHFKCSLEISWFLVYCFFSVIWNISQINVFKTKCKLKCQNNIFGKLFLKSGNTSVYFLCFHYWDLFDEHIDVIIDIQYLTL